MSKLLLHVCCGPCGIWVVKKLKEDYDVTLFFYNPNIWPKEEYERRFNVLKHWTEKEGFKLVEGRFNQDDWFEKVKGLEHEPEGGARCPVCFSFRLEETAKFAHEHDYDCFASTLTSGRNKKAEIINPIGVALAQKYGLKFIEADWKKQGGQEASNQLSKQEGMYRQHYCGCQYSMSFRAK